MRSHNHGPEAKSTGGTVIDGPVGSVVWGWVGSAATAGIAVSISVGAGNRVAEGASVGSDEFVMVARGVSVGGAGLDVLVRMDVPVKSTFGVSVVEGT